jgi:hypothetical protein
MPASIGELIRKAENEFNRGSTQISKHVTFSLTDTLEKIDAYLNSKHISGETDSLGRKKPFFNIVTAAANIWYRATDIDRKNIRIRAVKQKDWIDSFLATVHLQAWMRKVNFGAFLNDWGRVLSRYGSAIVKFVENSQGLTVQVVPFNTVIFDAVDFEGNPVTEIIQLTEAQLYERIQTHGYDATAVKALCDAAEVARETTGKQKKDNKSDYFKLYELHGLLSKKYLSNMEADTISFQQQMHVMSFVGKKKGRTIDYQDFTLFKGPEAQSPYMLTHLIKEDGRSLAIGAVETLFQSQWQINHSKKAERDMLDIISKIVFQTADANFVGRNVLSNMESGDIFVHGVNMPLTLVNNSKFDVTSEQNYAVSWKSLGNEAAGISEAMLGIAPKSGEAWAQTQAVLQESYSLFELMTENKGLAVEDWLRLRILPFIRRTEMDTSKEVSATLAQYDIDRIDRMYIKREAIVRTNKAFLDNAEAIVNGADIQPMTQDDQAQMIQQHEQGMQDALNQMGGQRFFKPSALSDKTWKEQFKDLEWEVEVEITGEERDVKSALTTLNTALTMVMQPGFDQNPRAKAVVGRIFELTGAMSPIEYNAIPAAPLQPMAPTPAAAGPTATLPAPAISA